jgi:hypothetical protein
LLAFDLVYVDGKVTAIGPDFLVGPIEQTKRALLDGGGTHLIQLGAFLRPLRPCTHAVEIREKADGLDLGPGACFAVGLCHGFVLGR